METLLQKIQQRIQFQNNSPQLECWLQDVGLAQGFEGHLTLICPNIFSKRWLEEKYRDPLEKMIQEETGKALSLDFRVEEGITPLQAMDDAVPPPSDSPSSPRFPSSQHPISTPSGEEGNIALDENPTALAATSPAGLNMQYAFSEFIVGPSNRFAWSAAQEICKAFRRYYNPLLITASTGLGKTHLAHAIGCSLLQQDPNPRVIYCTAESFFTEMIRHMKSRTIMTFKEKYRQTCDTLILDDIQFTLGKDALQSELCHTLDILLDREKRIILLGNFPTPNMEGFLENLRSRICSGLLVKMERPDYETRLSILHRLSLSVGIDFPEGTLEALARMVRSHVRDLQGAFRRLVALHSLMNHPVDPETLESQFDDLPFSNRGPLTLIKIKEHVARYFGLSSEELSSRSRHKRVLYPRQIAMYLSRKHTIESLATIGNLYKRDHSSVLYALRSLKKKQARTPRLQREIRFIEEKLLEKT